LSVLEDRLGQDNVEGMVIGAREIAKALGAGEGDALDWEADPFLFQARGVQLFFRRGPKLSPPVVVRGPRLHLDKARVGVSPPGHDALHSYSLDFDSDIHQRI
jgi:hypothetical protein